VNITHDPQLSCEITWPPQYFPTSYIVGGILQPKSLNYLSKPILLRCNLGHNMVLENKKQHDYINWFPLPYTLKPGCVKISLNHYKQVIFYMRGFSYKSYCCYSNNIILQHWLCVSWRSDQIGKWLLRLPMSVCSPTETQSLITSNVDYMTDSFQSNTHLTESCALNCILV